MKHLIDGVRYNVETYGQGVPVILLHGFTGDTSTWTPFYEMWGQQAKMIAIDIIGHGKTDSPEYIERYRMLSVVDDIFILMEKLKMAKADFVGYSMGGRLALSFALKYPAKVRKLVLESSSPGLEFPDERKSRILKDQKLASFIEEKGIQSFVEYWESIPLFESQKRLPFKVQNRIREQRLQNSIMGLSNSLRGMGTGAQPSYWNDLKSIEIGTLLITGELDNKFCMIAKRMSEKLVHSHWTTVDHCGHAIHVEEPEKFGTIVREFLSNT